MLDKERELVSRLVREASKMALEIQARGFEVEHKGVNNPVTEADRALNAYLVEGIGTAFPDDTIAAEESAAATMLDAHRVWFIDPIDGTKDFIKGNGEWSVMVGLVIDGRPIFGAVYQPQIDKLYVGVVGEGAWVEGPEGRAPLSVSPDADPKNATLVGSRSHPDERIERITGTLGITKNYAHGSVGCKLAQIAERRADMYFNLSGKCHMWDTAGPEAIVEAAGGIVRTLAGEPIRYGGNSTLVSETFVATTAALLPKVLDTVASMTGLQAQ